MKNNNVPSVVIIRRNYTPFGGAERTALEIARRLRKTGCRVAVAASSWKSVDESIEWLHIPSPRKPSWLGSLVFAIRCSKNPTIKRFDIVLSFERTLQQDIYRAGDGCHSVWMSRRRKVDGFIKGGLFPRLRIFHWVTLWLEKSVFDPSKTRVIIANSGMVAREIEEEFSFPGDRIIIIRNGVDYSRFRNITRSSARELIGNRLEIDKDCRIVLFLGSGFHRKGLKYAIRMLSLLDNKVFLVVIGKGNTNLYRRIARKHNIDSRVIFLGPVESPDIYIRGADLLVHPTLYDPSSNVCLESLVCGTPVITTKSNGAAEFISQGKNGWVVEDPRNVGEMAAASRNLLEMPSAWPGSEKTRVADWEESFNCIWDTLSSEVMRIKKRNQT